MGKRFFFQQCSLCHSAEVGDNGGAQGPSLNGVYGRAAASDSSFSYSRALKESRLVFDSATLDHFLSSPTTVVPGTAMVIAVPSAEDRGNLIAYFKEVKDGSFKAATESPRGPAPNQPLPSDAPKGSPDWKLDRPGRQHRIDIAKLPPPFATSSSRYMPKIVPKPKTAALLVPSGFKVNVFTSDLVAPRTMTVAPNGDIFVAETNSGRIKVMRPTADGARALSIDEYAKGLVGPFGIQFYPGGPNPHWLYVAELNRVVRYAYKVGDSRATEIPEIVVPQLYPSDSGGHRTRDIAFSPQGDLMYISVGSATNVAEDMSKKTVIEAKAWEREHGTGAAWDRETNRAVVMVYQLRNGMASDGKIFAAGIRNCAGLTSQPDTGDIWCTTNERDALGEGLVPDYSARVIKGGFYGWPWYYLGDHEDPRLKNERPDLAGRVLMPDILYEPHSAPLNMLFYSAKKGTSAFPKEYDGDAFVAFHGSWNRAQRTGQKVVRVRMKDGRPTGEYDDFLVGFIVDADSVWGRPVGLAVAGDGSLLVSEDGNNVIYRVSYAHESARSH